MNLLIKAAFAKWAGKSAPAVTKALKKGRLELYKDTDMINTGSPKSQAFKTKIGHGQKNIIATVTETGTESDEDLKKAGKKVLGAQQKKLGEEGEFKKQQRIEKELKNAYTRGRLIAEDAIEKSMMMFLDRWLTTNKRVFSAMYDDMQRTILAAGEKQPELKRNFLNQLEGAADEAKTKTVEILRDIQIDQGQR